VEGEDEGLIFVAVVLDRVVNIVLVGTIVFEVAVALFVCGGFNDVVLDVMFEERRFGFVHWMLQE